MASQVLPGVLSVFRPQLVLYDAGVDVHVDDALGRLAVTDAGTLLPFQVVVAGCVPLRARPLRAWLTCSPKTLTLNFTHTTRLLQHHTQGLARRELLVLDTCLAHGVPVAGVVGGGYHESLDVLAERHMLLHKAAARMWAEYDLSKAPLAASTPTPT